MTTDAPFAAVGRQFFTRTPLPNMPMFTGAWAASVVSNLVTHPIGFQDIPTTDAFVRRPKWDALLSENPGGGSMSGIAHALFPPLVHSGAAPARILFFNASALSPNPINPLGLARALCASDQVHMTFVEPRHVRAVPPKSIVVTTRAEAEASIRGRRFQSVVGIFPPWPWEVIGIPNEGPHVAVEIGLLMLLGMLTESVAPNGWLSIIGTGKELWQSVASRPGLVTKAVKCFAGETPCYVTLGFVPERATPPRSNGLYLVKPSS